MVVPGYGYENVNVRVEWSYLLNTVTTATVDVTPVDPLDNALALDNSDTKQSSVRQRVSRR